MVFAHVFVLFDFVCFWSSIAVSECFATGSAAGCVMADVKSGVDVLFFKVLQTTMQKAGG